MDYKLDYIQRILYKIKHKRTESYVISGIWHRLGRTDIEFVIQQYVSLGKGKYALADLYLPQLNMWFEINEPQHHNNVDADEVRNHKLLQVTGGEQISIYRYDNKKQEKIVELSLEDVNKQIEEAVCKIKERINELEANGSFRPWNGEDTLTVAYHQQKGYLDVDEREYVKTIDDVFKIFGANPKHKGWLRVGGAEIPNNSRYMVWTPSVNNTTWSNVPSDDYSTITEAKLDSKGNIDTKKTDEHNKRIRTTSSGIDSKNVLRVTFLKERDDLGFNFYKFIGVYEFDDARSNSNGTIWKRVATRFDL